jgi:phosphoribosyl-ATP pyrophosphohydrolase
MVRQFMMKHAFTTDLAEYQESPQARAAWHRAGLLRCARIGEELVELQEAWAAEDPVRIADAIADLQYTVLGAAVNVGFPAEATQAAFEEVHASNMTKTPGSGNVDGEKPRGPSYRPPDIAGVLARTWKHGITLFQ